MRWLWRRRRPSCRALRSFGGRWRRGGEEVGGGVGERGDVVVVVDEVASGVEVDDVDVVAPGYACAYGTLFCVPVLSPCCTPLAVRPFPSLHLLLNASLRPLLSANNPCLSALFLSTWNGLTSLLLNSSRFGECSTGLSPESLEKCCVSRDVERAPSAKRGEPLRGDVVWKVRDGDDGLL